MNSYSRSVLITIITIIFILTACTGNAEARKRGFPLFFVINTGDVMYKVADLPEEMQSDPEWNGWVLGYKCSHFGILWADFRTWDRQLVVFKDSTFSDLPTELRQELEIQYPFSDCQRNVWNRFGWIVLTGVLGTGIFSRFRGRE